MGLLKEFKEFAVKGNVIDLAVGVIIGGAFGKIVSSFVNDVVMPPLGLLIGGMDFKDLAITLKYASVNEAGEAISAVTLNYGMFIQNIVDFTIIAFVIFLAIKGINSTKKKEEAPKPAIAPAAAPAASGSEKPAATFGGFAAAPASTAAPGAIGAGGFTFGGAKADATKPATTISFGSTPAASTTTTAPSTSTATSTATPTTTIPAFPIFAHCIEQLLTSLLKFSTKDVSELLFRFVLLSRNVWTSEIISRQEAREKKRSEKHKGVYVKNSNLDNTLMYSRWMSSIQTFLLSSISLTTFKRYILWAIKRLRPEYF